MPELRRQFELPTADVEFLDGLGLPWETIRDGGGMWLLVHQYLVPAAYQPSSVSAAVSIPQSYPDAPLDMVYFRPHLARVDRSAIGALADQAIDGATWQRWSRHRTGENPWRVGHDSIETHFLLAREWLDREVRKAA